MPDPTSVLVLGGGRIAQRVAGLLAADPRFAPRLATRDPDAARDSVDTTVPLATLPGGALPDALGQALRGMRAVILADPLLPAPEVARAAIAAGCHYLDVSESAASAEAVSALDGAAWARGVTLAPGCGLAPGYVTALAAEAVAAAGPEDEVTVFVGVLPAHPANRLGYADTWGIDGLIEEYTAPCRAVRDGRPVDLPPLTEVETVALGGKTYEAFTTAGSLDTLAGQTAGRVRALVFKTLRYPGHLDYMRFLLDDLGLSSRLYQLRTLLRTALPRTDDDRVLVAIRSRKAGQDTWRLEQFEARKGPTGQITSAISTATAAHVCAMLDAVIAGHVGSGVTLAGTTAPAVLRQSRFFDLLAVTGPVPERA